MAPHLHGLLCMLIISVSSGTVYVQSGSDITDCNMKCLQDDVTVELYRVCRGEDRTLLENHCYFNFTKSHDPRLQLHTGSGCWKLTSARKDDSCVYKMWCHCAPGYVISSTEIRVLDPVLISNITSNFSQLGEDMAVSVHFSGEESAVTWEVDGEPLPERYWLIDDNRTLIIPNVQRDDTKRRFQVRITNPVSEEIREYQLILNPTFRKLLATEDPDPFRRKLIVIAAAVLVLLLFCCITAYQICSRRKMHENMIPKDPLPKDMNVSVPVMEIGYVSNMENLFLSTMKKGPVPILEIGSMPIMGNVSGTTMENEPLSTIYKGIYS